MTEIMVGACGDLADGDHRIVAVGELEVGIFRLGDRFVAYENRCPHHGGPVCQGRLFNRVEEIIMPDQTSRGLRFGKDRHVVCPWHGYAFASNRSPSRKMPTSSSPTATMRWSPSARSPHAPTMISVISVLPSKPRHRALEPHGDVERLRSAARIMAQAVAAVSVAVTASASNGANSPPAASDLAHGLDRAVSTPRNAASSMHPGRRTATTRSPFRRTPRRCPPRSRRRYSLGERRFGRGPLGDLVRGTSKPNARAAFRPRMLRFACSDRNAGR